MLYVYAFDSTLLYGVLVLPPDSINLPCPALFVFATIVFIVCIMQSNPLLCQAFTPFHSRMILKHSRYLAGIVVLGYS